MQMPRGVPVATVAINNATNAGLLAVRMLGMIQDADLLARFCSERALCYKPKKERNFFG